MFTEIYVHLKTYKCFHTSVVCIQKFTDAPYKAVIVIIIKYKLDFTTKIYVLASLHLPPSYH